MLNFVNLIFGTEKMIVKPLTNEIELLANLAAGDQHAFTVIFEHYQRFVFSFSKKLTSSDEDAAEVVQDIFLKIWLNRENLKQIKSFGAYLNRLVRNQSLNVIRHQLQHTKSTDVLRRTLTETDESTLLELEFNDINNLLNQVIAELSPQQRKVYQLCHQQGLKYNEAAAEMNISAQTVNDYMKDALKKIRAHFKEHSVVYSILILYSLKK